MGVTINKKSTTTEPPPENGQQPKLQGGLNAFYWYQVLITYSFHSLTLNKSEKLLKDLNELFFNFIWTGTNRIKRTVLCQEDPNGGYLNGQHICVYSRLLLNNLVEKVNNR